MKQVKLNLRGKFLIVVFLGLILSFGAVASMRIYLAKKNLAEEIERSGQERVALIAEAYSNILLSHDNANLESLTDRLVVFKDVNYLKVSNRQGKILLSRISHDVDRSVPFSVFSAPIKMAGLSLGSVEMGISHLRMQKALKEVYYMVATMLFALTIFFGSVIYWVVSVLVIRPLVRLSEAADQLSKGNYSAQLPLASDDEMGNLTRTFAAMRNNRKLNEESLSAIFDYSPDIFVQLDAQQNIINWNNKAEQVFGYARAEVVGKDINTLLQIKDLSYTGRYPVYSPFNAGLNEASEYREAMCLHKDGKRIPVEIRMGEIPLGEGRSYIVAARDITERRESESKLLEAMKAADSANKAKSAFLSIVSHEIRTPMNSIIGMASLALKTVNDPKQRDYLDKINYAAHHLLILINDILDFSKIEANKVVLEIADFELNSVFENISNQFTHSATSKGLTLSLDFGCCAHLSVRGDALRLAQILLNLTGNAIKFTSTGGVNISAEVLEENSSGYLLRFTVRDTGIGISADDLKNLFQPFHQTDHSMSRNYGGTGLGLAISKQLSLLMGGDIGVDSVPAKGSTFWFTARLGRGEAQADRVVLPVADISALAGLSVLLVDDNLFNQQVAREILRDAKMQVTIANNGKEAIEKLLQQKFYCVLMDVQMPVMDGLEATRQIRATPALAHALIVAMTANAGRDDRERCFAAGMNDFISKPIFPDQLFAMLLHHLPEVSGRATGASVVQAIDVAANVDDSAVIDLAVLEKMFGDDPVKVEKFALKFLHSARIGLDEIDAALAQEDWKNLAALGHRNKSPARTVGANGYAALCLELESFKDGADIGQAAQVVLDMRMLLAKIEAVIKGQFK